MTEKRSLASIFDVDKLITPKPLVEYNESDLGHQTPFTTAIQIGKLAEMININAGYNDADAMLKCLEGIELRAGSLKTLVLSLIQQIKDQRNDD